MATFRVERTPSQFATINKTFIYDSELSFKAKGIMTYLLSRPDDWEIYTSEIEKHAQDKKDSVSSGIKELMEKGYIERKQKRSGGKFGGYDYSVYEKPKGRNITVEEKPQRFNRNGESEIGESSTTNNNITNNNITNNNILSSNARPYQQIINYLNDKAGKNFKYTTEANKRLINGRYNDGYTLEDFMKVIDNKVAQWKGTDSEMYLRPKTLFSPSNFEGYLNEVSKGSSNFSIKSFLGDIEE